MNITEALQLLAEYNKRGTSEARCDEISMTLYKAGYLLRPLTETGHKCELARIEGNSITAVQHFKK